MSISNQDGEIYQRFGGKTLFIFVLEKLGFFLFLFVVFIAIVGSSIYVPQISELLSYVVPIGVLALAVSCVVTLVMAWLDYIHYVIFIGDKNIEIQRGILTIEEMGVPFRKIRNVKSSRNIFDQLLGISHITVTISGEDGDKEVDIVLPALKYD